MKKKIVSILFMIVILIFMGLNAQAAQDMTFEANCLLELLQESEVYADMDTNATVLITLEKGTAVFSKEASQGEWIQISYQDITGYVQTENVHYFGDEGLDAEFEQIASLNELLINELEYIVLQKKQKTTWTLIIVALVVAIFAVSIASAVLKNIHDMEKQGKLKKRHKKSTTIYKHQKHG